MKIAILGTKGVPGHHGVEVVVDSLLPHLTAFGHEITVYGYDSYTSPTDNYQGVRIKTIKGSTKKNLEMISHMWKSSRECRKESYDIIHIHSTDPCLLAWLPKARHGLVATSHGQAYVRKKWGIAARTMSKVAEQFFLKIPNVITSVSKPLADYYKETYGKEVLFVPNGINFREKPDSAILQKWNVKPGEYFYCTAGRIERTKGLDTLVEAYSKLNTDIPLLIAGGGSGSDFDYFEHLKKNSPPGVNYVGFLTGDELFALYAHAKVFLFPSEYEAMSMALLEGLSFGVPTIYSNIPENEAVAANLAYSFKVSNSDSLKNQLDNVLAHYDQAELLGQKAKKVITSRHDWKTIAGQYNEIYCNLAGSN